MAKVIQFKKSEPKRICIYCKQEIVEQERDEQINSYFFKPENVIYDYCPCLKCENGWKTGYPMLEMSTEPQTSDMPEFVDGCGGYPTGRSLVLNENPTDEEREKGQPMLMTEENYEKLLNLIKERKND